MQMGAGVSKTLLPSTSKKHCQRPLSSKPAELCYNILFFSKHFSPILFQSVVVGLEMTRKILNSKFCNLGTMWNFFNLF